MSQGHVMYQQQERWAAASGRGKLQTWWKLIKQTFITLLTDVRNQKSVTTKAADQRQER